MRKRPLCRLICLLLSVLLTAACLPLTAAATPAEDAHLHFDSRGKFRILNFSDIQDDALLDARTKAFIRRSVTDTQPDLIVLTGDNVYGNSVSGESRTKMAIAEYMDIFESLGVPVAIVFGNHDDDGSALSKETQMAFYRTYSVCIAYDEGSALDGCGTYNVPIYGSVDRDKVAFNLWMFDTGSSKNISGYDYMRANQLNWYVQQSDALKNANGGVPVPSIAFQHIVVREIYSALKQVSSSASGAVEHDDKYYVLPDSAKPGSVLLEAPCPSKSGNEFSTVQSRGDVLAIVCGHDHINQFVVPYQGVDLICTPSCGYSAYANNDLRGARVIDLDEDSGSYATFMVNNSAYALREESSVRLEDRYVKDVALCYFQEKNNGSFGGAHARAYSCIYNAVDAAHGNGVVLATDLNAGSTKDSSSSNHVVVYMGYTLTSNPNEALRGLSVFFAPSGTDAGQYDGMTVDGSTWVLCNAGAHEVSGTDGAVNLNRGTSGTALYLYATYSTSAGSPITEIRVVDTSSSAIRMADFPGYSLVYPRFGSVTGEGSADLNKTAGGDYVYALCRRGGQARIRTVLDSAGLRGAYIAAQKKLAEPAMLYDAAARQNLADACAYVKTNYFDDLDDDGETTAFDQASLDAWTQTFVGELLPAMTARTYTVTFQTQDGTVPEPVAYRYGDAVRLGSAARPDHTFRGWRVASSAGNWTQGETFEPNVTLEGRWGDVTLTAEWTPDVVGYTVAYYIMDLNGLYPQTPTRTEPRTGRVGETAAVTPVEQEGFSLDAALSDLSGVICQDGSLTLTVYFTRLRYTVRFLDDDGRVLDIGEYYYDDLPLPECPEKAGNAQYTYTFVGWSPAVAAVTGDADYTAVYTATPVLYTLVFDANGGICGVPSKQIGLHVPYGTLPDAVREGYRFLGWFTQQTGGAQITPDSVNATAARQTLYAHWQTLRVPGDADGDGTRSLQDVTQLIRYLAGGWNVTVDASAADVNGDGTLNLRDVTLLRRYLAGWDVTLL